MSAVTTENFSETGPMSLNLFSVPPTQTAIENVIYEQVRPISQISGNVPIDFVLSGQNGMQYVDLKQTKLQVKVRIKNANGNNLATDEYVGPVNLFMSSMFSQIDITLQSKNVTSTTSHYPYKAMIQALLCYGNTAKESQLTTQIWAKDNAGHLDDADVQSGQNGALYVRSKYFSESKLVDLEGYLVHDLCSMNRYILNQVAVGVKLYRSKPEFNLMSAQPNPNYEVIIEDIVLKVAKVAVSPSIIYAHAEVLKHTNAKYPFTKTEVKLLNIPAGQQSLSFDNLFQGLQPSKVVVTFVDSSAINGSYVKNPFNFQNMDLTSIGLYVNSLPVSGNIMKLNYKAKTGRTIIPVLINMLEVSGKWLHDSDNGLNRDDIGGGYALYCYSIEPNFGDAGHYLTLLKQGNVRLEATFGTALPTSTTCIVYAEYPGYFEISASRDII